MSVTRLLLPTYPICFYWQHIELKTKGSSPHLSHIGKTKDKFKTIYSSSACKMHTGEPFHGAHGPVRSQCYNWSVYKHIE